MANVSIDEQAADKAGQVLKKYIDDAVKEFEARAKDISEKYLRDRPEEPIHATSYHPGRFEVTDLTNDKEEIFCPTCGTFERREKPKPIVKEVVKEVAPKDVMPKPHSAGDVLKILDMGHADGKSVFDCPNCAREMKEWTNKHIEDLKKIGIMVAPEVVKKK